MTYEVTCWLPAIVKAVAGTFSAWSLSTRQAVSTKQVVLQTLFMWTGNDIGHANWWTHKYHASARVGQPILKQGLNMQATENEIMSCGWIFRRSVDTSITVQIMNVSMYWMFFCDLSHQSTMYENNEPFVLSGLLPWTPVILYNELERQFLLVLRFSCLSRDYSCYM